MFTKWQLATIKLNNERMAVSHNCPTTALLRYSGSVTYFGYPPSPAISVPCIWTLLSHLITFLLNITFEIASL